MNSEGLIGSSMLMIEEEGLYEENNIKFQFYDDHSYLDDESKS